MKLAVFSDSHGLTDGMVAAARRNAPDVLVHLGDHIRDSEALARACPGLPLYAVPGNCDYAAQEPDTLSFLAGPVRVFAAHGHRHRVKLGLSALLNAAHFSGAQLVLYGHTHIPRLDYRGDMTVLNPGAAGPGAQPSFALVEIGPDGRLACRILEL